MERYATFWVVTMLRGLLAVLIGSAVLVVPDMARTLLFLPFAIAFVVLSLAVYGVADSVLVCVTSFFTPMQRARVALRLQSLIGFMIGVLFCSILFDRIKLEWFLYLIALQAFATSYAEFVVAQHTSHRHGSRWSYVAAAVALVCAMFYVVAATLAPMELTSREIAVLAYTYLAAFGLAQTLMAFRMLQVEQRAERPAALQSK